MPFYKKKEFEYDPEHDIRLIITLLQTPYQTHLDYSIKTEQTHESRISHHCGATIYDALAFLGLVWPSR